jgi:ABC-type transporter MlaC component
MSKSAVEKIAMACWLLLAGLDQAEAQATGDWLTIEVERLNRELAASAGVSAERLRQLMERYLDLPQLEEASFADYLERTLAAYAKVIPAADFDRLMAIYRSQLLAAYKERLVLDLLAHLRKPAVRRLEVGAVQTAGDRAVVSLQAVRQDSSLPVRLHLRRGAGNWKIADLEIGGALVSAHYRDLCRDILRKDYSLPMLLACLARREYIVLDDFSTTPQGALPTDWGTWRERDMGKPLPYRVQVANGKHYLAARDTGHSVILGKFIHWDPHQYPLMTWCWQANALPPGGNELLNEANDSAAGIYVIFSQNWLRVPKQVKYVWSTTLPEGTVGRRNKLFRPWVFVVESGEANLGKWTFEMVDLFEDHRQRLGGKPAERTIGLGILTDANSTGSYAEAFYADLRAWTRAALAEGRVENYCDCLQQGRPPGSAEQERLLGRQYTEEESVR